MPKNYNIKTVSKRLAGKGSHVVFGSSVAAGMTRYVTMVKVANDQSTAGKSSRIYLCSTAASNTANATAAASTAQKMRITIQSALATSPFQTKEVTIPRQPDTENPLFTIAASKWLSAYLCSIGGGSSPVNMFVQYYDQ